MSRAGILGNALGLYGDGASALTTPVLANLTKASLGVAAVASDVAQMVGRFGPATEALSKTTVPLTVAMSAWDTGANLMQGNVTWKAAGTSSKKTGA